MNCLRGSKLNTIHLSKISICVIFYKNQFAMLKYLKCSYKWKINFFFNTNLCSVNYLVIFFLFFIWFWCTIIIFSSILINNDFCFFPPVSHVSDGLKLQLLMLYHLINGLWGIFMWDHSVLTIAMVMVHVLHLFVSVIKAIMEKAVQNQIIIQ